MPNSALGDDGQWYEIYQWVEGGPRTNGGIGEFRDLGAALAAFHRTAVGALAGAEVVPKEPRSPLAKARYHHPLLAGRLLGSGEAEERHIYRALTTMLEQAGSEVASGPPGTRPGDADWVLHGDPCEVNSVRAPNGDLLLIDLDDVHEGPAVSDLAWAMVQAGAVGPQVHHFRAEWDVDAAGAVLEGYLAGRPAAARELTALRPWLQVALCCAATDELFGYDGETALPGLIEECGTVVRLGRHIPRAFGP